MDEARTTNLPGRPPGIRADAEGLTQRQRRVIGSYWFTAAP
jgi:hypothetical protein